jgi:hypothetical protein
MDAIKKWLGRDESPLWVYTAFIERFSTPKGDSNPCPVCIIVWSTVFPLALGLVIGVPLGILIAQHI